MEELIIKVVIVIEHVKRELKFLQILASRLLECDFCTSIEFISLKFGAHKLIFSHADIYFLPFSDSTHSFPLSLILACRKNEPIVFNLGWEQELHQANKNAKAPKDEFCAKWIKYISWSEDYHRFLIDNGVPDTNIIHSDPYNSVVIANSSSLELWPKNGRKNIFFPLNFGWVFLGQEIVKSKVKHGYGLEQANQFEAYSKKSFSLMIELISVLLEMDRFNIILRPHPFETTSDYRAFLPSSKVIISDEYTALDFLKGSDFVISNWSSVVLDAVKIGKPGYLLMPPGKPEFFQFSWEDKPIILATVAGVVDNIVASSANSLENIDRREVEYENSYSTKAIEELGCHIRRQVSNVKHLRNPHFCELPLLLGLVKPIIITLFFRVCWIIGLKKPIARIFNDAF